MGNQLLDLGKAPGVFYSTYVQKAGKWQGCDWPTAFGVNKVDLNGLRPSQVTVLGKATSGSEADDWRAGAEWLAQVERDAKLAEAKAAKAADLAEAGRLTEAVWLAEEACVIERRYHASLVWQPLREAIATALAEEQRGSIARTQQRLLGRGHEAARTGS